MKIKKSDYGLPDNERINSLKFINDFDQDFIDLLMKWLSMINAVECDMLEMRQCAFHIEKEDGVIDDCFSFIYKPDGNIRFSSNESEDCVWSWVIEQEEEYQKALPESTTHACDKVYIDYTRKYIVKVIKEYFGLK
jgi:hypothetical protein